MPSTRWIAAAGRIPARLAGFVEALELERGHTLIQPLPPPGALDAGTTDESHTGRIAGPFRDEDAVMIDAGTQHDDISTTQSRGNAATRVSAEHVGELQYTQYVGNYLYNARSSPRGVSYYPESLDSAEEPVINQQGKP